MRLNIATWNINSVRLRMPIVAHFLKTHRPDVLCLQETKCRDGEFPLKPLKRLGYKHIAVLAENRFYAQAVRRFTGKSAGCGEKATPAHSKRFARHGAL